VHFHDTYFIVAHFHYVMMGSTLFAFLGGMYYWWPKITGKMCNENWSRLAAVLVFVGFNLTFFIQFVAGSQGMPRRYASYPQKYQWYHVVSTIGAYVMTVGLVMVLGTWLQSLLRGRRAPANPWGANTLEWHTPSPPPHDNFATTPDPGDPYDMSRWRYDEAAGGYVEDAAIGVPVQPAHH
jgi:cytochrome c oxidase subunit 1